MPNWCNNTISLTGPKEKIKQLFDKTKASGEFLEQLCPCPEELNITAGRVGGDDDPEQIELVAKEKANLEKYGYSNWYDWKVAQWGTKWDVDTENLELSKDGTTITGWFDSAWAPPIGAYEYFLTENEDCSISSLYYEGGMDFAGKWEDFADMTVTPGDFTADEMEDPNSGLIYDINEQFNMSEFVREYEEEQKTDTEKFIVDKEPVNA
jgi:hypothetical protein